MPVKLKGIILPSTLTYPKLDDFKLFDVMAQVPVTDGLVGSYFLGSKNAAPTYNFANPSLPLSVHFNPDFSDPRFSVLSVLKGYFDTGITPTAQQTVISIAKIPNQTAAIVSSYLKDSSGNVTGDTILESITATKSLRTYAQSSSNAVTQSARDNSSFNFDDFFVSGGVITGTPSVGAWIMSETASPAGTYTTLPGRVVANRTLRIGASYSSTEFTADIGISAVVIYNKDIGSDNITTVMNWLRNVVGVQAGIWSAPKG
ncbi:TPA: hypothetical protein O4G09_005658 [Klebsiella michiganensis]|nr:hypothetical protein [Klebsiella michiganensis]